MGRDRLDRPRAEIRVEIQMAAAEDIDQWRRPLKLPRRRKLKIRQDAGNETSRPPDVVPAMLSSSSGSLSVTPCRIGVAFFQPLDV